MKRFHKAAAIMLSAVVLTGAVPAADMLIPVYAAQEQAQQIETVIKAVKGKIEIPAEFSKFSSDSMQDEDKTIYGLNWEKEDGTGNIYVQCDTDGNISSYHIYMDGETESVLNISKEEARQAADAFLKQAAPERFADANDCLVLVNDLKAGDLNRYYFSYVRKHEDIEVMNNSASVSVVVKNGEPVVNSVNIDWSDGVFSGETQISLEDAKTVYAEKFPLELGYHMTYGEDKKSVMAYSFDESERFIDAQSGKSAEVFRKKDMMVSGGSGAANESVSHDAEAPQATLTPEEQEEVKNYEDMAAVEAIKDKIFAIPELKIDQSAEITSSYVNKDTENNIYYLRVSCKSGEDRYFSFTTDAQTGELYRFYQNTYTDGTEKKDLTAEEKETVKSKIEAFIKEQNPDKYEQLRLEDEYDYKGQASLDYVRMVNGIPFRDHTVNASWDVEKDVMQSYSVNWSKLPEDLADPNKAVSAEAAVNALYEKYPLQYLYVPTQEDQYTLCIAMKDAAWEYVDGLTGRVIKYDGSDVDQDYTPVAYTDLDGHWAKDAVEALASVGIGLPGTEFKADEIITQGDLLYMLLCVRGQYVYHEVSYDDIYRRGASIIPEAERDADAPVTREKAVKYMLVNGEYDKAAQIPGIFKTGFADEDQISQDCIGYVAIAKGLGMINGNGEGFAPQENITRGQAAVMLYQYLMR